ncbi:MAG: Crp/Fnr family transcriptional regulator [Nitrosomonas sp.]|nr:Crp/Fnr family transcriptional regulator [Nitrosomonas sp.]
MADTDKYYYNALDKEEANIMQNIIYSKRNSLLNKFTIEEYAALSGHLEFITMGTGEILYEADEEAPYVLFPIDSKVSLLHPMRNGNLAEIALIGCDGAIGIVRKNQATLNCAVVAEPGNAYRIRKNYFMEEIERNERLFDLLVKHTQVLLTRIAQITICHSFHTIDQQLCRWLLMNSYQGKQMPITEHRIASLLGVPAEAIMHTINNLMKSNLINYHSSVLTILNQEAIAKRGCECPFVIKNEIERLL